MSTADGADCNVPGMVAGIQSFLNVLDIGLQSDILKNLPIIGEINQPGGFFGDVRDVIDAMLTALANTDSLRNFIFQNLGPGDGGTGAKLDILVDENGDPIMSLSDIGNMSDPSQANYAVLPTEGPICGEVKLNIGDTITIPVNFDLGLDAFVFDVEASGGLDLVLTYNIQIGLGIDKAKGIYLILNEDETDPEIELDAAVQLQDGTMLTVDLFFLRVSASEKVTGDPMMDDMYKTGITGFIDLNINGPPSTPTQLPLDNLTSTPFMDLFDLSMGIEAMVDLTLEGGTTDPGLPSILVDFFLDWEFTVNPGDPDPFMGELKDLRFDNFRIDLGEYVSKVLKPIVQQIDEYLQPLDPLIEFISLELPIISQVSELLGQGPVTVLDVIGLFGEGADTVVDAVDIIIAIRQLVKDIANSPGTSFEISFGSFDVLSTGKDPRDKNADIMPSMDGGDITGAENLDDKIDDSMGESSSEGFFAGILNTLREIGVTFPLLEDPLMAFNLLFGQNVDLVKFDLLGTGPEDRLQAGFDWSISLGVLTPPVPLYANIFAGFNVFFDLVVGYDTYGLLTTGNALDGFYFGDEKPVFGIGAEFGAGAEINAALIWAGVQGKVAAEIGAGWNEVVEDDKMRFQEIAQRLGQGIECLFELRGSLDAVIEAYAGLGIKIFGAKITIFEVFIDIFRATIFEFSAACPPLPPPQPARLEGGVLKLNIGPDAHLRQSGAEDGDEKVDIKYDDKTNEIVVSGFGVIQKFDASLVNSISGDGGAGVDEITVDKSVAKSLTLSGGDGDDILFGGSGVNTLMGGAGNDQLTGGPMGDTISGGDGDDSIVGAGGDDNLDGGDGDDQIRGDDGNDIITGGPGDDDLSGGLDMDTISGNEGNDHISGGPEGDTSTNILHGNDGDDAIEAGGAGDMIFGDAGNDILNGNMGPDIIHGGTGDDMILAGAGTTRSGATTATTKWKAAWATTSSSSRRSAAVRKTTASRTCESGGGTRSARFLRLGGQRSGRGRSVQRPRHTTRSAKVRSKTTLNFEDAYGGAGDDTFYDNRNNNFFRGNGGNDRYMFHRAVGLTSGAHIDTRLSKPAAAADTMRSTSPILPASDPLVADVSVAQTLLSGVTIAVHATRTV